MTARTRAPAALSPAIGVAALVAVAAAALVLRAPAASADLGDQIGGTNDGGSYSAWAWYTSSPDHDEDVPTPNNCTLEDPETAHMPAHWEYTVLPTSVPGTYSVSYGCAADILDTRTANQIGGFQDWQLYDNQWTISVTPAPIEDLVSEALTHLDPQPPSISTNLGDGVDGLVHVSVTFQLQGNLGAQTGVAASAGPITVVLTAWPNGDVPITWHTGDRQTPCEDDDPWGACTHDYGRSSFGQNHEGLPPDHYRVTAGITFTGRYDVFNGNDPIAGADIGNVDRTVQLGLAVDEGQAVNMRG
jgi:hypothetical protein